MRRLYLADVKDSGKHVTPYAFFDKSKLNVDSDKAGIAFWLDWLGEIAEVAILESKYCTPSYAMHQEASKTLVCSTSSWW